MCGIVGVIDKQLPAEQKILAARDALSHRGPCDTGLFYDAKQGIALAHRRLSIIDLSTAGRQPITTPDGRYTLIFNGEIYNYVELRDQLRSDYAFTTNTDSEVLLAAYVKWGVECLSKFNGMFSFAVWDRSKEELFVARDRLGIKPLFFYHDKNTGRFTFASEIKALFQLGVPREINDTALYQYLAYGLYDHSDHTFFKGVDSLRSGHYMIYRSGEKTVTSYWNLEDHVGDNALGTVKDTQEQFLALMKDAIKLRFRSDVPIGINLSSGLDSHSLYHFGLKTTSADLHTFSMCVDSKEYNECPIIETALSDNQRRFWHPRNLDARSVWAVREKMCQIQDQPFGGVPTLAYDLLMQEVSQSDVVVILEGQGLDELLAGYRYYQPELFKDINGEPVSRSNDASSFGYSQDMSREVDTSLLNDEFVAQAKQHTPVFQRPFDSHLLNAQYRDLRYTKLPRVLRFNDHASMAYGLELRVPFLDHRIVEFCFSLPAEYKINNDSQKVLMRNVMGGIVPESVKQNQKKAFGAVQTEWFRDYFKEDAYDILKSSMFQSLPYWDHNALMKRVDSFFAGEGNNSFFIWQCINLEMWIRNLIRA